MSAIGWLGSLCFALCAIPQAYKSYEEGNSNGVSWGLLILWLLGEILTLIYVIPKKDLPLIVNYLSNLFFLVIIIKYKIKPRRQEWYTYD